MGFKALVYAYILGGFTFIPLVIIALISFTIYTSVPVGDADPTKDTKHKLEEDSEKKLHEESHEDSSSSLLPPGEVNDIPRTRKGWLTMRRTFEESSFDGSYVTLVRSFLDARSKDPKRSRPKDMWYVVLKGKVLYLYEDEGMTECEAVLELGGHEVVVYPEGQLDGELFAKRNAICLRPKVVDDEPMPSVSREMKLESDIDVESKTGKEKEKAIAEEKRREAARNAALNLHLPWFIFVRTNVEMEDWYMSLVHASDHPANTPTLGPLQAVFQPSDMNHLVSTLDEQPDVIPMRWLNALIGRLFFSFYKTQTMETLIISRLMKKLSKVKRPAFLTDIVVTEVSVGNTAPTFSKPMLKELTKEGDASLEVQLRYKGEVRITVEATATINLGTRFKSYTVKLVLAAVLREIEGNLLIKVKRPPSNRIWYAFTAPPKIVLDVEPIVSDRQITWTMILNTIEARLKEIIQESVVMPNMDDIAFFDSDKYDHRGGIWADAVRHERSTAGVPESHSLAKTSPLLSASVPDIAEPMDFSSDPDAAAHKRSHSAEENPPSVENNGHAIPHSVTYDETMTSSSAASTSSSTGSSSTTGRSRRRTWFSSVGSADLGTLKDEVESTTAVDTPRGRAAELDTTTTAPRSKSTPNNPETPRVEKPREESQEHLTPNRPPALPPRRSPSPSSASSAEEENTQGQTVFRTPSGTSRTKQTSPNSTSTFLTNLRTRAAATDKQAIQNQAKEAMRKWGVNWGGLRRDGNGGSGNSVSDDMPDAGPSEARIRVDSNSSSKRGSYADVRAAVAERKGQNRHSAIEGNGPSAPVAIPEGGRIKVRSVSASSGSVQIHPPSPSFSAVSASPPTQLSRQVSSSVESGSIPKAAAAAPVMSRSTNSSHSNDPFLNDRDVPEGEAKRTTSAPVRTQPSMAKTMTIPGIHASHRGEVMSMGYVAPPPPPPASTDNKIKAPAIQSVYRLWKSPTMPERSLDETDSQTQPPDAQEYNTDVVPLTLSPEESSPQTLPPKPQPPPLPPRSHTSSTAQSSPDTPQSPASEALKYIASRDERRHSQNLTDTVTSTSTHDDVVENSSPPPSVPTTTPTKPPLPPRRISTTT